MSDSKLDKLDIKIDKIQEKLSSIDVTLAAQHESLKIHIKRTDLLEKKLAPVETHVIAVHSLLKLVGFISIIVGIIEGVFKIKNG